MVFPELSIPFSWIPFIVDPSRRRQIAFIFGAEYFVRDQYAFNLVVTTIPYIINGHHHCLFSLRLKNHYSPAEEFRLGNLRLERPNWKQYYEQFIWKGVSFTVFNCFELSDIIARGRFRSKVDFLTVVAWNPDIRYYSNLVESTARDLHCYVVQSNNSAFGDSRVFAPQDTKRQNVCQVTGGRNSVLLKSYLDIPTLRDFQQKEYDPIDKRFKPTPAGYDHESVYERENFVQDDDE